MVLVRDGPRQRVGLLRDRSEDGLAPDKLNCGWSSLYFCNQRIYSPRHARGEKPQWDHVSVIGRYGACLLIAEGRAGVAPPDPQARQRWLEKMQADYDLFGPRHLSLCGLRQVGPPADQRRLR